MTQATSFDSLKTDLPDLLRDIETGKIQLPDFQRGWIWNDDHIKSLLASVSRSFPIGAIMMLESGGSTVKFKPRLVEGLSIPDPQEPQLLILDGQQRLTSLYQALLMPNPVKTTDSRRKQIARWYYIDMVKALDPDVDREEAIVGMPEDRRLATFRGEIELDCSTPELERSARYFPCHLILDTNGAMQWQQDFVNDGDSSEIKERLSFFSEFFSQVIKSFQSYALPEIRLKKDTPKEAVCLVFEKVNTGGVQLTVFELLTATFAADNFALRDDWKTRKDQLAKIDLLSVVQSDDFLQAITLLASRARRHREIEKEAKPDRAPGITCKRRDILNLKLADYLEWADVVTEGFERAAKLIMSQRISVARDLPYRTQLVPLAATMAILGSNADQDGVKQKIAQWYWCGVLGELYGSSVETRFARDLPDLLDWISGGPEPKTVSDAEFSPNRLLSLRTRNSAAYKGLFALVMKDGGLDFRSGDAIDLQTFFDENVDIHHIFPRKWCEGQVDKGRVESFVNKTAISSKTNRMIGGDAPSIYLDRLQEQAEIPEDRMDEILESHLIDPLGLRADDFDYFFEQRVLGLVHRIEMAMGKSVTHTSDNAIFQDDLEEIDQR